MFNVSYDGEKSYYYILTYDIKDKKTENRVYTIMRKAAISLQKSVYVFPDSDYQLQKLHREILQTINTKKDDLRIYKVACNINAVTIGKNYSSEGILIY